MIARVGLFLCGLFFLAPLGCTALNADKDRYEEVSVEGALTATSLTLPDDGSRFVPHTVKGRAGETVSIHMQSSDFDAYLLIVNEDEDTVGQNDDCTLGQPTTDACLNYTFSRDMTLKIIANAYDAGGLGDYVLTYQRHKP